jgi:hypothetical protein
MVPTRSECRDSEDEWQRCDSQCLQLTRIAMGLCRNHAALSYSTTQALRPIPSQSRRVRPANVQRLRQGRQRSGGGGRVLRTHTLASDTQQLLHLKFLQLFFFENWCCGTDKLLQRDDGSAPAEAGITAFKKVFKKKRGGGPFHRLKRSTKIDKSSRLKNLNCSGLRILYLTPRSPSRNKNWNDGRCGIFKKCTHHPQVNRMRSEAPVCQRNPVLVSFLNSATSEARQVFATEQIRSALSGTVGGMDRGLPKQAMLIPRYVLCSSPLR